MLNPNSPTIPPENRGLSPIKAERPNVRWHVIAKADWLAAALDAINRAAAAALAARGAFHLVLAGGGTPEKIYRALAQQQQYWAHWHIWFGDERCLPADDAQRNSHMAAQAWLNHVAIPAEQIYAIAAELGAEKAAQQYANTLKSKLQDQAEFDLVLLGLGQDGHTASLFPQQDWGEEDNAPDAMAVANAPKPPPDRVTLSARRLSQARGVVFLICGADKREALTLWRQGAIIPATSIQPLAGIDLLIDTDACPPGEPE